MNDCDLMLLARQDTSLSLADRRPSFDFWDTGRSSSFHHKDQHSDRELPVARALSSPPAVETSRKEFREISQQKAGLDAFDIRGTQSSLPGLLKCFSKGLDPFR